MAVTVTVTVGGATLLGLFLFTGCSHLVESFEHDEYVVVIAPPVPSEWYMGSSYDLQPLYRLRVTDELGRIERHEPWEKGAGRFELTVPKERITAVSYEVSPLPGLWLKAAGGVYPLHREPNGTLSVSYENGYLAELLHDLLGRNPGAVRNLNIGRLEREILERSDGNPWQLDREAILRRLSSGSMRADAIRLLPATAVKLELLDGAWISLNPLEPPLGPTLLDGPASGVTPSEPPQPVVFEVTLFPGDSQRWYHPEHGKLLSAGLDTFGNVESVVRDLSRE